MADHSLPDEIISEILSPALKVPEEVFADTSDVSPFAAYSESSSAYLLVCKSWLRVATPLLYHVVILRSKAQAKALGQALTANNDLGQLIKKLRVEGGYGAPMGRIMQFSPNISDLLISFEIWASDNTGGLCKGLPLINPTRVIIIDAQYRRMKNKMTSNLEDALTKAISKWDHLSTFDMPYWSRTKRALDIVQALAKARRLQTIIVPVYGVEWVYTALKECPLQSVEIKDAVAADDLEDLDLDDDPKLKSLLRFTEDLPAARALSELVGVSENMHIAPSLDPSFIPMNAASEDVQAIIWKHILHFAMSVPVLAENPEQRNIPRRLPLLLVSKFFYRVALPHLYVHVQLNNSAATSNFSSALLNNPALGALVRTIYGIMDTSAFYSSDSDSDSDDDSATAKSALGADCALTILSQTTGLVRFCDSSLTNEFSFLHFESPISWAAFEALIRSSGSTLQEFSKRVAATQGVSAAIFNDMPQLRTLDWKCETSFDCTVDKPTTDGLSNLADLRIWVLDSSFLTALCLMKLPSLRYLTIPRDVSNLVTNVEAFLETHGSKLTQLHIRYRVLEDLNVNIFELCPSLSSVSFTIDPMSLDRPPHADKFSQNVQCSLEKIKFNLRIWDSNKDSVASWESFFSDFESKYLPNLREIEFPCFEWPTNERNIAKSYWVRWAESLLRQNINLTDTNGKKWRPRLKMR
ncbi:hypothetical protein DFH09DRAFT_1001493 [Mycena vulgaris]|nr:hypothetical protein DFH09DRAFT_1001493 [Mycena vulgaris]